MDSRNIPHQLKSAVAESFHTFFSNFIMSDEAFFKFRKESENKTAFSVKKNMFPLTGMVAETLAVTCFGSILSIVSFRKQV